MIAQWVWLGLAVLALAGNIASGFRPLLSLAGGFLAAAGAAWQQGPFWSQFLAFLVVTCLLEVCLKSLFRRSRQVSAAAEATAIMGTTGKIQDVVNRQREIFLLHAAGKDWLAVPRDSGTIRLGDTVRVEAVSGRRLIVHRHAADPD